MLKLSLAIFTVVALIGLMLARNVFAKRASSRAARTLHVLLAAAGSVLILFALSAGATHLWINVGLAVVIVALGVVLGIHRARGNHPKNLVLSHAGIAVVCYLILAYFALV